MFEEIGMNKGASILKNLLISLNPQHIDRIIIFSPWITYEHGINEVERVCKINKDIEVSVATKMNLHDFLYRQGNGMIYFPASSIDLVETLRSLGEVKELRALHAKVYVVALKDGNYHFIMGSGNLTNMGSCDPLIRRSNIEYMSHFIIKGASSVIDELVDEFARAGRVSDERFERFKRDVDNRNDAIVRNNNRERGEG